MNQPPSPSARQGRAETGPPSKVEQHPAQQAPQLDVLRLLLQWLCAQNNYDKAVLCKLLCCSTATTALVHETCAGQVTVHWYLPDAGPAPAQLCSWLAKHARLLGQLHLLCSPFPHISEEMEEFAAAGLRAAAGAVSMRPAPAAPSCSRRPDPAQTIMRAEATAQRGILLLQPRLSEPRSSVQQAQPAGDRVLPLLQLKLRGALEGTLLPTISACCRHLTQLELNVDSSCSRPTGNILPVSRDLPFLQDLIDLRDLRVTFDMFSRLDLSCFSSLQHLTKLELDLPDYRHDAAKHLPLGLVEMSLDGSRFLPDLQRLTNLTRLRACSVDDPQMLPAQLPELHLDWFEWNEGFLQLQELKSLQIEIDSETIPDLAALTAWTHLTALRVNMNGVGREYQEAVSGLLWDLPKLPLVALQVWNDPLMDGDLELLGECTQLTKLDFSSVRGLGVGAFAKQLQKLQGLECLNLHGVYYRPKPQLPDDMQPLVDALRQLYKKHLRQVSLSEVVLSGEQQLVLRQLLGSHLTYTEGEPLEETDDEMEDDEESDPCAF